ncbi:hypothetical protein A1Q1_06047 [Trichosporon asahii var. asahii CBS 2479]|uniref:Alpha-ketoglutarate-dependent dioxygenase AlkB-like domain-containing protein n=1 Tax=Trichosporon asahii var. asahii (strain ATCC 90039 / CBS 2479 / JCM 2466 / KCTC 7840 / NBRC 103889/ NCYC 2677 / UAMH 7654) TaxID=1186058 RepID=J5SGG1_TRIAS|nr:hypothetical protein A1Q1_06047 [Trichosporon asahii var. asahii CBS 2479]EJT45496.1 hypothetical protein A1Q1_06047 [Trichosporon asahii var. asahii CBS 2479]
MAVCRGHAEHTETLPALVTGAICQQSQVALRFRQVQPPPDPAPASTFVFSRPIAGRHAAPTDNNDEEEHNEGDETTGTAAEAPPSLAEDFAIYPSFFNEAECRQLLSIALWKLDRLDVTRKRGSRRRSASSAPAGSASTGDGAPLQDMFTGTYGFEEYREALISNYPPVAGDVSWLSRLYQLVPGLEGTTDVPPPNSSTHALHLSPEGEILAHVDNVEASGQTIVGASLGAARILRLEDKEDKQHGWDVLMPSGSVYMQKGDVRYGYEHSVLGYNHEGSLWDGERLKPGHRVSFMVRVS